MGKTTTAFALAQFVNCEQPTPEDACGECRSCRRYGRLQHPDLHWIFPMPGSSGGQKLKGADRAGHVQKTMAARQGPGIHVLSYPGPASIAIGRDEDTRVGSVGELRREAGYAPMEAKVKVFVVTEADRMTREAANSLLKVLEEPPPQNLLILTAERPGELLDTIVSRCHSLRFDNLPEETVTRLLLERGGTWDRKGKHTPPTENAAALAAALAGGSLSRGAELVQEDVVALRDEAMAFLDLKPGNPDLYDAVAHLDQILGDTGGTKTQADRRAIEAVVDFGMLWLGDLLRVSTGSDVPLANRDREADLRAQAGSIPIHEILRRTEVLAEARAALRGNVYRPLVLFPMLHGLAKAETP